MPRLILGYGRGDRLQRGNLLLLAIHGNLNRIHNVAELERAELLLKTARGDVVVFHAIGQESDVHTLHHLVGVGILHGRDVQDGLLYIAGGQKCAQGLHAYWHALTDEFGQALGDFLQHALDDVERID